jgi:DNA-binding NtrC family response regulator
MKQGRRLICTLGLSPAVVTEALDKYLYEEHRAVTECVVVHTNGDRVREARAKLEGAFGGGRRKADEILGAVYSRTLEGEPPDTPFTMDVRFRELPFPDFCRAEEHDALLHELAFWLADARQRGLPAEVCLAGGRKTESACAAIAGQFFGAERVVHVLPVGLSEKDLKSDKLSFPLDKYLLVPMPFLDLSPVTWRIVERRGDRVGSPEDAGRLVEELRRHIPLLAAAQAEKVYAPREAASRVVSLGDLRTANPAMAEILETARVVASSDSTILLTGETGVGKEVVARAVHGACGREGRMASIRCNAPAESLFESELFGHEKGAFNEAEERPSPLEDPGAVTIFLDEIDSLTLRMQAKLLHVFQERRFQRVGGNQERPVHGRFIVATNRDLPALVKEGKFRDDLFQRLDVISIEIPPLRERKEDIPLLAQDLFDGVCRHGKVGIRPLRPEELEVLEGAEWRGNVRQMENALKAWVTLGRGAELSLETLRREVRKKNREIVAPPRDEVDRLLSEIMEQGPERYRKAKGELAPGALCALIQRARACYNERFKGKVKREEWFQEHFGVKSLDPDCSKARRGTP